MEDRKFKRAFFSQRPPRVRGLCRVSTPAAPVQVRLLGSGTLLAEVQQAATLLRDDWGVVAEVWSATRYSERARDAREAGRWNRLHPEAAPRARHLQHCLPGPAPVVATSDWVCAWPHSVAAFLEAPFTALGTDGFGRSDTRAALRGFFEIDHRHIVLTALAALSQAGLLAAPLLARAMVQYGIDAEAPPSWQV